MLTNKGLVEHVRKALSQRWGYVWGTYGEILTPKLLQSKKVQYPSGVGDYEDYIIRTWLNKRTVDCVGLIKSYLWSNGEDAIYNPNTDISANGMFELANEKGTINSLPNVDLPGLCLWKDNHIGVYVGQNQVIEARGTIYGVILSPLRGYNSTNWTHWIKCPFITYEEVSMKKDYIQIIKESSDGSAEAWVRGIDTAVAAAKAGGDLGALEIFRFLPQLIEKIGNK